MNIQTIENETVVVDYLKRLVKQELVSDSIELAEQAIEHFQAYDDDMIIMINIKAVQVWKTLAH